MIGRGMNKLEQLQKLLEEFQESGIQHPILEFFLQHQQEEGFSSASDEKMDATIQLTTGASIEEEDSLGEVNLLEILQSFPNFEEELAALGFFRKEDISSSKYDFSRVLGEGGMGD